MKMDELAVQGLCEISVWDSFMKPPGWRRLMAVFLGEQAGRACFLVRAVAGSRQSYDDETLADYARAQPRWTVYADEPGNIREKDGCFRFVNTLGMMKKTFLPDSYEAQRFDKVAREAGLAGAEK